MNQKLANHRSNGVFLLVVGWSFLLSGCGTWLSNVRSEPFQDQAFFEDPMLDPTQGGFWPEGNLIDDPNASPSDVARSIASVDSASSVNEDEVTFDAPVRYSDQKNYLPRLDQGVVRSRVTREDFIDDDEAAGSLWASNGQTNYFFTQNKIKSPGDLVTITTDEKLKQNIETELKRSLTVGERAFEIMQIKEKVFSETGGPLKPIPAKEGSGEPDRIPTKEEQLAAIEVDLREIDLKPLIGINAGDPIVTEVVERYKNGNYRIQGTKRISYRDKVRHLTISAVGKKANIEDSQAIPAEELYEYRIKLHR